MTFLLQTTLYLTVTALFVLLFKRIFKNKLSAKWQVYIWALLLIRFCVPSLPQSPLSVFNAVNIPSEPVYMQQAEIHTALPTEIRATDTAIGGTTYTTVTPPDTVDWQSVIACIWLCGAAVLFLYFLTVYCICLYRSKKQNPVSDAETLQLLEACKQTAGVKQNVRLIAGESPMLMGWIRPKIVLPDGYSKEEQRSIFIHELCHLKSSDIPIIWIAVALLCTNWFNPVLWYAFFTLRRDIEVYCDERVLTYCQSKKEYANLLLKSALAKNKFVLGTTSLQNGEKEVERRIKYMAYFKKPKAIWSILIAVAAIAIAAICLTNAVSVDIPGTGFNDFHMYRDGAPGDADRGIEIIADDQQCTLPIGEIPIFVNGSIVMDIGAIREKDVLYIPVEETLQVLGKKYISKYEKHASEVSSREINGHTYVSQNTFASILEVQISYYDKDENTDVAPYFANYKHVIISGGIKQEPISAAKATELLRGALISAYENTYTKYEPLYEDPGRIYDDEIYMRYIIANLAVKAETDRFYQFPVVYDFWVDKYTGEIYAYYNGIAQWVYRFDPYAEGALLFAG